MKEDVGPPPEAPPRKRRVLQDENATPDRWLAIWSLRDLPPSTLRAIREEQQRRKALRGRENYVVAFVRGNEGMTPDQRRAMMQAVPDHATQVLPVNMAGGEQSTRAAIAGCSLMLAAPREMTMPANVPTWERSPVWAAIAYAKNRRIPVQIILPNGEEGQF